MMPLRFYCVLIFLSAVLMAGSGLNAQSPAKKKLDHSVYGDWKSIRNIRLSPDGKWLAWEVNPGRGDGALHLMNLKERRERIYERGTDPGFSPGSGFLVYRIKPPEAQVREARRKGVKSNGMPKDSLGIYRLQLDLLSKVPRVERFSLPEEVSSWLVLQHYYRKDTVAADTSENGIRLAKPEGSPSKMVVMDPVRNKKYEFENVYDYILSGEGTAVVFTQFAALNDTLPGRSVCVLDPARGRVDTLFTSDGSFGGLATDRKGKQFAFLHHPDSGISVGMNLHYRSQKDRGERIVLDTLPEGMQPDWGISIHGDLWFSGDGSRLYFGTAPKPRPLPEDTLLPEEKYGLDVWNWQDQLLQPMQKKQLERDRTRSYLALWHTDGGGMVQLADSSVESVSTLFRGNGDAALGSTDGPYRRQISWKVNRFRDYYLIDTRTGERELILKGKEFGAQLSPAGKYIVWYETGDSNYYSHSNETGERACLTCGIDATFHEVRHDQPSPPPPYGIAGFTENDESILIYSRYDLWKMDPAGRKIPVNLTGYAGHDGRISFRYRHLEYDDPFIPLKKPVILEGYHELTRETGIYSASAGISRKPVVLAEGPYRYRVDSRARDADVLCWQREDFDEYPDIWVSDMDFREQYRATDANPQAGEYFWGSPRLVHWDSYAGDRLDGILYIPEDFDPSRKYPMLVYFYEKRSNRLYWHVSPAPSRSSINIAMAVSNGYVVFVPDVTYREGYPGQSAFDAVVSGTLAMCGQFPFIDRENLGIDGQSWGGYQVAWLVTRTGLFKAAMAGAPVSNMTSAYGGIRWETGASRMMQYEEGQSRIGGTLWDRTELYLENSPIFRVPDVETALLIMHNDNDGSVPWYQGIELFVALRRLGKPAWMLVYNNEEHNLSRWPNRVDLSIRMMQFFDHYLKDAPAPAWMDEGIPALEKGRTDGYELIDHGTR
jgi:dipeptidyl aminopeptidase/acylaminoacyl peptidase